jgi:broad specificity phosphatase PhoE
MSTAPTQWWWIRHAPVPDGGRIYGQRDLACDCTDATVFTALARELPRDAVWVTSNLRRTIQTATTIRAAVGGPHASEEPLAVPELAEQNFGEWQGLDRAAFVARQTPRRSFWLAPADMRAPGGESFADMAARVTAAIERLTQQFRGRTIISVGHGGPIKIALGLALNLDLEGAAAFLVDNCSITRIEHVGPVGAYSWRIGAVNHRPWSRAEAPSAGARTDPAALVT